MYLMIGSENNGRRDYEKGTLVLLVTFCLFAFVCMYVGDMLMVIWGERKKKKKNGKKKDD